MKAANSPARARFVAALIPFFALACGVQNSERAQAQALLERIANVDLHAPFDARAQQIEALRSLKVTEPALYEVRERCVQAHAGLLAAEREQVDARVRIDRAEDAGRHDAAEIAGIAKQLSNAAASLRAAHAALPECERRAQALVLGKR